LKYNYNFYIFKRVVYFDYRNMSVFFSDCKRKPVLPSSLAAGREGKMKQVFVFEIALKID